MNRILTDIVFFPGTSSWFWIVQDASRFLTSTCRTCFLNNLFGKDLPIFVYFDVFCFVLFRLVLFFCMFVC